MTKKMTFWQWLHYGLLTRDPSRLWARRLDEAEEAHLKLKIESDGTIRTQEQRIRALEFEREAARTAQDTAERHMRVAQQALASEVNAHLTTEAGRDRWEARALHAEANVGILRQERADYQANKDSDEWGPGVPDRTDSPVRCGYRSHTSDRVCRLPVGHVGEPHDMRRPVAADPWFPDRSDSEHTDWDDDLESDLRSEISALLGGDDHDEARDAAADAVAIMRRYWPGPVSAGEPPTDRSDSAHTDEELTGDCELDCQEQCAYPGQFSECDIGALSAGEPPTGERRGIPADDTVDTYEDPPTGTCPTCQGTRWVRPSRWRVLEQRACPDCKETP